MGKIIEFAPNKSLEDTFMESLSEQQLDMFNEILMNIQAEQEELEYKFIKKVAECEMLRLENESLKGGRNDT